MTQWQIGSDQEVLSHRHGDSIGSDGKLKASWLDPVVLRGFVAFALFSCCVHVGLLGSGLSPIVCALAFAEFLQEFQAPPENNFVHARGCFPGGRLHCWELKG